LCDRAVADVEARAVARALHLVAVQFPIPQRSAIVRADVGNGVEATADVKNDDRLFFKLKPAALALGDIRYFAYSDKFGRHLSSRESCHVGAGGLLLLAAHLVGLRQAVGAGLEHL